MREIMPVPARPLALLLLVLLTAAALAVRLAAAPTGEGYRLAMAASADGSLYVASASRGLLLVTTGGAVERRGALPSAAPLALAAGDVLVLGAEDGLFVSSDGGRTWRKGALPGRRFLAVAADGADLLAAAWADGIWASDDAGATWRRSAQPAGGVEVESLTFGAGGAALAGGVSGLLTSDDLGDSWRAVPEVPGRVTVVGAEGAEQYAATWDGRLFLASGGWREQPRLAAGVWAYDRPRQVAATASGLYLGGRRVADREAVALADAAGALYAGFAGGQVEASPDGRSWRRILQA